MPKREALAPQPNDLSDIAYSRVLGSSTPDTAYKEARLLPLDLIDPNSGQFRQTFNEETIRELADSIAEQGLIEPLVVRRTGDRYEVVAGERRRRALQLLAAEGRWEGPVGSIVRELDDAEAALIIAAENLQREDLSVADEAVMYDRLMAALGLNPERGARELGRRLGIDYNRITRVRRVAQYPALLGRVISGEISLRAAINEASAYDLREATSALPPDVAGVPLEDEAVEDTNLCPPDTISPQRSSDQIFQEQQVAGYTRKVPGAAWKPFYSVTEGMSKLWKANPAALASELPEAERLALRTQALQAREQLDRLIDVLGKAEEDKPNEAG